MGGSLNHVKYIGKLPKFHGDLYFIQLLIKKVFLSKTSVMITDYSETQTDNTY